MSEKILLVEDSEDFARVFRLHLEKHGYTVEHARDGEQGLQWALSREYSVVVLDIGLPKRDGLEVLGEIRKVNQTIPVLMLTIKDQELDKVVGLDLGADDYVTKPFNTAELISRINALIRRSRVGGPSLPEQETGDVLVYDDLRVDLARRRVTLAGKELEFTSKEFELLAFFASNPGEAFSRDELLENVWEYDSGDYTRAVNNLIMRLRRKIERDPAEPRFIKTVRGYGYRFADKDEL